MIQTDYHCTREDGIRLFRSYSDAFVKIRRKGTTDEIFIDAIDPEDSIGDYEETDEEIIVINKPQENLELKSMWEEFLKDVEVNN